MSEERPLQEQRDLEELTRLSDLFKFYLELVLKVFVATLGIAGGVTTFVLTKQVLNPQTSAFGLLLPAALCLGMGLGLFVAMFSSFELAWALKELKKVLGLRVAPHGANLWLALSGFGILLFLCGCFLVWLSLAIHFGWIPVSPMPGH
jgi:hypothetical protein